MPEVLIISDHDSDMQELKVVFRQAGLASEVATSMTAGCESAISGRFHVLFSSPLMAAGSWRRLIELRIIMP
jgi:hypothetical protein